MPVIRIEVVGAAPPDAARKLADALGEIFGSGPGGTWVRLLTISRYDYAENGVEASPELQPVFVSVLRASLPDAAALRKEAERVAVAVAALLSRPVENVHVIFEPEAAGRVAFGGKLLEK